MNDVCALTRYRCRADDWRGCTGDETELGEGLSQSKSRSEEKATCAYPCKRVASLARSRDSVAFEMERMEKLTRMATQWRSNGQITESTEPGKSVALPTIQSDFE